MVCPCEIYLCLKQETIVTLHKIKHHQIFIVWERGLFVNRMTEFVKFFSEQKSMNVKNGDIKA